MTDIKNYTDRLVGRIYKLLCIREENPQHAIKYLENLLVELRGARKTFNYNSYFVSILFSLEGMQEVTDYNLYRRKVFECIDLVNKLKKDLD